MYAKHHRELSRTETHLSEKLCGRYSVEHDATDAKTPWSVWSEGEVLASGYSRMSAVRNALIKVIAG